MQANSKLQDGNAYDAVPYTSHPFPQTNPASLQSIAYLFGLSSPNPETARILELGCASGNNILAIATRFPKAECVGIDLSGKQIADGQAAVDALGVKNLRLEQKSILDIDKSFGTFDYIICHGVFSWVPADVQEKILQICNENLSPDGVAYVSYNTLPGWSAVKAIREMMLYHTQRFAEPKQKAEQARLLLSFIRNNVKDFNKSFYADVIENEFNVLKNQSDWYLLHDHLEENNSQHYFHEFMAMAEKNNLQYLAETTLSSMFSGNLPPEAAKALSTSDDIVRSEQYMDFIYNRRFRSTLLCRKDRILRRNLVNEIVEGKLFSSNFTPDGDIKTYSYGSGMPVIYHTPSNLTLTTTDMRLIAAFTVLNENGKRPMALSKLCKLTLAKLKENKVKLDISEKELGDFLVPHLLRSIFLNGIIFYLADTPEAKELSVKPKVYNLAAYQVNKLPWVTNLRQETVTISELDRALLPLLNGARDAKALAKELLPLFENKQLNMTRNEQSVTDMKEIEKALPELIDNMLQRYLNLGLLSA